MEQPASPVLQTGRKGNLRHGAKSDLVFETVALEVLTFVISSHGMISFWNILVVSLRLVCTHPGHSK